MVVQGAARVIDGDSLAVGGEDIRLRGVDAPEASQTCEKAGQPWDCGAWSTAEMARRVAGQTVRCQGTARDRYGRLLATCTVNGTDLAASLARAGAVVAYRRYAADYVADEALAINAAAGVWAGPFTPPETFRRAGAAAAPPCAIKGNFSAKGRIYHSPGQRDYAATKINAAKGERWFCAAQEAEAAGWRAARR